MAVTSIMDLIMTLTLTRAATDALTLAVTLTMILADAVCAANTPHSAFCTSALLYTTLHCPLLFSSLLQILLSTPSRLLCRMISYTIITPYALLYSPLPSSPSLSPPPHISSFLLSSPLFSRHLTFSSPSNRASFINSFTNSTVGM